MCGWEFFKFHSHGWYCKAMCTRFFRSWNWQIALLAFQLRKKKKHVKNAILFFGLAFFVGKLGLDNGLWRFAWAKHFKQLPDLFHTSEKYAASTQNCIFFTVDYGSVLPSVIVALLDVYFAKKTPCAHTLIFHVKNLHFHNVCTYLDCYS